MRRWMKFFVCEQDAGGSDRIDASFPEHAAAMAYTQDDRQVYADRESFFQRFFYGFQFRRFEYYHDFVTRHVRKTDRIFSVAGGRCANELFLMREGYTDVTCSDLDFLPMYDETKNLFPGFTFAPYDVLRSPPDGMYDAILSLGLVYLFDDEQMHRFFSNVASGMKENGGLILDSAGSPDTLLSHAINEWLLYAEAVMVRWIKTCRTGKPHVLVRKHHGYRRTDEEIVALARDHGLHPVAKETYAFLTEFRRSIVFNLLVPEGSLRENLAGHIIGNRLPYVRMFLFRKSPVA